MHKDLETLIAVQAEDAGIRDLEARLADVDRREGELDARRSAAADGVARQRAAVEREDERRAALAARVDEHRLLQQRNLSQLDQVRRMREATAAQAQVDMAQRILADEERELQALVRRVADGREGLEAHEAELAELDASQQEVRDALAAERTGLRAELDAARRARDERAAGVPRQLLSRYERIRDRRRGDALFRLRGLACGSCDTAIPLQRRNLMVDGAIVEVCEGCGVLLYAAAE